ncbi:MAG: hypothetical protein HYZ54_03540 [Ignavibacteriae bacterium]|nr:hypothetical protein [Ignavibacteriota bacterium]
MLSFPTDIASLTGLNVPIMCSVFYRYSIPNGIECTNNALFLYRYLSPNGEIENVCSETLVP